MHIALIISSLETGGAERVLSELANAWISRGYKISLITLGASDHPPTYPLHPDIQLIYLDQKTTEDASFIVRFINIIKRILKIRQTVKTLKPNIVVSFIDVMNMTTLLATRKLRIPVIVSERTHPFHHQIPEFYKKLRTLTYPWASKVITQTHSANDCFSYLLSEKKAIIPNTVKRPKRQKSTADILKQVHKIISVGRLCPNKGFSTLITAFSKIVGRNPELTLTIYGEGGERTILEALIHNLGLSKVVFLPGVVRDIETVLYEADLFAFPSHYEGFPNALCEAMAIGLPVIASNCSGNVDIVRDGVDGRLFGVGDLPQLTRLLRELIEDAPQRLVLSKGAITLPDRYREESVLQMWDDVLREGVESLPL
jgi:GalNAc-alpha-(1->4)-GalNAc-alpha-(1->3)-diNAcBac-PP-undecaprenol alpha-1,4-N-acetyl-D-galactosaminyltransferase